LQENVRVRINESGENRGLGKIDELRARRSISARRDGDDLVTLDQDERILNRLVALSIDQLPRADGHAMRRLGGGKQGYGQAE
jgi:hypothetical protein